MPWPKTKFSFINSIELNHKIVLMPLEVLLLLIKLDFSKTSKYRYFISGTKKDKENKIKIDKIIIKDLALLNSK